MNSVSWHSSVSAEEMTFGEVEGDEIVFRGQASERSRAETERRNLPPAVTPHRTYSDVRIDLHVEAEIDAGLAGDDPPQARSDPNGSA